LRLTDQLQNASWRQIVSRVLEKAFPYRLRRLAGNKLPSDNPAKRFEASRWILYVLGGIVSAGSVRRLGHATVKGGQSVEGY
jgi:hypothetical protein